MSLNRSPPDILRELNLEKRALKEKERTLRERAIGELLIQRARRGYI